MPARAADPAPAATDQIGSIAICEDENEWPPYSYFQRKQGKPTRQVVGYAVDVIDEIFKRHQIAYHIDMIPWNRCMAVAALGKEYQLVFNLSYNPERLKTFLFSRAYYATTTYYFYSRRNNPTGLAIKAPGDVKKYRICGVRGYNYTGYGLAPGDVDQGSGDFTALVAKLQLGRCALFLEKKEIMAGYAAIGRDYLADPDIASAPVPGVRPSLFYYGVSRNYALAPALMRIIDDELLTMESSGRLHELWAKAAPKLVRAAMTP